MQSATNARGDHAKLMPLQIGQHLSHAVGVRLTDGGISLRMEAMEGHRPCLVMELFGRMT